MKEAGILMPVTSLPSPYGIGTLGREAYAFIDFIGDAGMKYWQVLPLGPTGYGDSPYQSFSSFAGNPYLLDLDLLALEGLIEPEKLESLAGQVKQKEGEATDERTGIDYGALYQKRIPLLRESYQIWKETQAEEASAREDFEKFCLQQAHWLEDYALFMALKNQMGGREWLLWPEDLRRRREEALQIQREILEDEIGFWCFVQHQFFRQWQKVRAYAHGLGIRIIGDIPMYIAMDSADAWTLTSQLLMDEQCRPTQVAGVPPDLFSETGQLWGNPLYDWEAMKKDDYWWWRHRMAHLSQLYDVIRIDHFLGVARYYCVPEGAETAMTGEYKPGPGRDLIRIIEEEKGTSAIIAEDLGVPNPEVEKILEETGYPGMKVLLFAFDGNPENPHLPEQQKPNVIYYGGTHDNDTLLGFLEGGPENQLVNLLNYLSLKGPMPEDRKEKSNIRWMLLERIAKCPADRAIFQIQDLMGLGNEARINEPSTLGKNWKWQARKDQFTPDLKRDMKKLVALR